MINLEDSLKNLHRLVRHKGWLAVRIEVEQFKFSPCELGVSWVIIDPQMNVGRYGKRYTRADDGWIDWNLAEADVKAYIEMKWLAAVFSSRKGPKVVCSTRNRRGPA
jgi:hypothetical protein